MKADRLMHSFHYGSILGMDVAIHKPLIVTSGADKSIRVWNYLENTLEVTKYFQEEAQRYFLWFINLCSISLHPSGLYILAGFSRSLKLMTLLIDDIRPYWECHIPGCREVCIPIQSYLKNSVSLVTAVRYFLRSDSLIDSFLQLYLDLQFKFIILGHSRSLAHAEDKTPKSNLSRGQKMINDSSPVV